MPRPAPVRWKPTVGSKPKPKLYVVRTLGTGGLASLASGRFSSLRRRQEAGRFGRHCGADAADPGARDCGTLWRRRLPVRLSRSIPTSPTFSSPALVTMSDGKTFRTSCWRYASFCSDTRMCPSLEFTTSTALNPTTPTIDVVNLSRVEFVDTISEPIRFAAQLLLDLFK
jgi:hypothetical protein